MDALLLLPRIPFAKVQFLTVVFSAANTDTIVPHTLLTDRPTEVRYLPVGQSAAGSVYHDTSATARQWGSDFLILRCSTAPNTVRLLLFTERQ